MKKVLLATLILAGIVNAAGSDDGSSKKHKKYTICEHKFSMSDNDKLEKGVCKGEKTVMDMSNEGWKLLQVIPTVKNGNTNILYFVFKK